MSSRSRSLTTTNPDWLHNSHAGELLLSEFMEPSKIDSAALGAAIDVPQARVDAVIQGRAVVDAELDLRLARYFGMSEGFFLGLQIDHDLLAAKRALNGELERILPRAA